LLNVFPLAVFGYCFRAIEKKNCISVLDDGRVIHFFADIHLSFPKNIHSFK